MGTKLRPEFVDDRPGLHVPPWVAIPLSNGIHHALIDLEDYPQVCRYNWHLRRTKDRYFWAGCNITKAIAARDFGVVLQNRPRQKKKGQEWTGIGLHQLIMGRRAGHVIDHVSGCPLDCRRANMRWATLGQNARNKRKGCGKNGTATTSQFKGVSWNVRRSRWFAQIEFNHERYLLGNHLFEEAAARAYDHKARELFGSFAVLNFPNQQETL